MFLCAAITVITVSACGWAWVVHVACTDVNVCQRLLDTTAEQVCDKGSCSGVHKVNLCRRAIFTPAGTHEYVK